MMEQLSLLYPNGAGWKAEGTSKAAAKIVTPKAKTLCEQVYERLQQYSLTADEAAFILGKSVLSIRPRFSQLLAQGKIYDTGRRRKNESGLLAVVWRAHV